MNAANDTHSKTIGYILWIFGFTGSHRFYYGKPVTGTIWFFTLGLLGIGWLIDVFLIPGMDREADCVKVELHRAGAAHFSGVFRRAPLLHGQVGHGDRLPVHRGPAGDRLPVRFLDAERSDYGGECVGSV
jgi:TM2 domain-containing membrane protein YozV